MRLVYIIVLMTAFVFSHLPANAQFQTVMKSYNFSRAMEEVKKGNNSDAYDFLSKETSENPNNGYAYFYMAILQADAENYSDAMKYTNMAIKKFPKKENEYTAKAYASRAGLYAIAGDTVQALTDYDKALRLNSSDENILENHAQLLYELKRYSDADVDYRTIVSLNPNGVMGYMGLGRNAFALGNYDEAIHQYNIVIGMYSEYSSGYAFRAESYLKLGKYLEAIDDIIKSLSIDSDAKAHHYLFEFPKDISEL